MSYQWLTLIIVLPFIGSFLGVVIRRLPTKRPLMLTRSTCDACGHVLGWRDLVPIVSWQLAGGRCRYCRARISIFYPAMELASIAVVLWTGIVIGSDKLWLSAILGWTLLVLAVIDWNHLWLPDVLTIPLATIGLVMALWLGVDAFVDHAIGAIAGLLFFGIIGWAYRLLRSRDGLGLGDAKLLAASGAWVAWQGLPTVVLFGAALGLVHALVMAAMGRPVHAATKLPFGTHLCLATWVVWLYGPLAI